MKKWTVLIFVLLLGLLLGQRQLNKKNELPKQEVLPSAQVPEQIGVPLPPGAVASIPAYSPTDEVRFPTGPAAAANKEIAVAEPLMCANGSIKEMMASEGKTWGRTVPLSPRLPDPDIAEKLYGVMGNYLSCKAAATGDLGACKPLPTSTTRTDLRRNCVQDANKVLFSAYMLGKTKDREICDAFVANSLVGATLDRAEFCSAASKGLKSLSKQPIFSGKKKFPIPLNREGCNGSEACLSSFGVYEAIEAGNPSQCYGAQRQHCEAYLRHSQLPCADLAREASMMYCSYLGMIENSKVKLATPGIKVNE